MRGEAPRHPALCQARSAAGQANLPSGSPRSILTTGSNCEHTADQVHSPAASRTSAPDRRPCSRPSNIADRDRRSSASLFLTPDGPERLEAAFARRLDRMTRQYERLGWHVDLTNETLALFIRFWLTNSVPLADAATPAAKARGRERWEHFVEVLTRKMELGPRMGAEISRSTGTDEAQ